MVEDTKTIAARTVTDHIQVNKFYTSSITTIPSVFVSAMISDPQVEEPHFSQYLLFSQTNPALFGEYFKTFRTTQRVVQKNITAYPNKIRTKIKGQLYSKFNKSTKINEVMRCGKFRKRGLFQGFKGH